MPYLFGGLVVVNAIVLGFYLFLKEPTDTKSLQMAKAEIQQPLDFVNSAQFIPPPIGSKN